MWKELKRLDSKLGEEDIEKTPKSFEMLLKYMTTSFFQTFLIQQAKSKCINNDDVANAFAQHSQSVYQLDFSHSI